MKKRILALVMAVSLILSMSVITVSAESIAADTTWYGDGSATDFTITTAAELAGLSSLVDGGTNFSGKTVKLGADIVYNEGTASEWATTAPTNVWEPAGNTTYAFQGTFDGQGHTISGLYVSGTERYIGLFAYCKGATLKDFKITNSYFSARGASAQTGNGGTSSVCGWIADTATTFTDIYSNAIIDTNSEETGGICGRVNSCDATFTNCQFDGHIIGDYHVVGGLVGRTKNLTSAVNMTNCAFTGIIDGDGVQKGGMIGLVTAGHTVTMTNCMVTGTVSTTNTSNPQAGVLVGRNNAAAASVTATGCFGAIGGGDLTKLCGYNTITGSASMLGSAAKPYMDAYFAAGVAQDYSTISAYYANTSFNIGTAAQLVAFSAMSQAYNYSGKTVNLTADITLNTGNASDWATTAPANIWLPIGNDTQRFAGTFDGHDLTISGMYCARATYATGMFGVTSGATIKDFKLVNSYFGWPGTVTAGSNGHFGAIIGWCKGASVSGIYSDAIVNAPNCNYIGGLVGSSLVAALTVSNCQFAGSVTGYDNVGGFLGGFQSGQAACTAQFSHCLFTGTVTANSLCGGIAGLTSGFTSANIADTLSAGSMTCNSSYGSLVGSRDWGSVAASKTTCTNAYGTSECCATTIRSDQALPGGTNVATADITGAAAYTNAPNLDYTTYWVVPEEGIPELQKFSEATPAEPPEPAEDISWYSESATEFTLTTSAELLGLAKLVDDGKTFSGKTVKLGGDIVFNEGTASAWATTAPENIWNPIGDVDSPFSGTFDGQGYTISGLYVPATADSYIGLIASASGATVKNVRIENSYFANSAAANHWGGTASVVGYVVGNTTFTDIYSDAIIVSTNGHVGGICGRVANCTASFTNCWYAGKLTGSDYPNGGILGGTTGAGPKVTVTNCAFTGILGGTGIRKGGIIGHLIASSADSTITNCMVTGNLDEAGTDPSFQNTGYLVGREDDSGATVSSGCFGIAVTNGRISGSFGKLIQGTFIALSGGTKDYMEAYYAAGAPQDYTTLSAYYANSSFNIGTAAQLVAFSVMSQAYDYSGKTVNLTADITLNTGNAAGWAVTAPAVNWTPIGINNATFFAGTVNGNGHTISGIYCVQAVGGVGFIGRTNDTTAATVRNLKLVNSYFKYTGTATWQQHVGAVVGWLFGGTVSDIYTDAIVDGGTCTDVAGIVGTAAGKKGSAAIDTLSNCWFDGTVTGTSNCGGLVGGAHQANGQTLNLEHCLFTGTVTATQAGGLVGNTNNFAGVNISDSFSNGLVTGTTAGSLVALKSNECLFDDCYGTVECNAELRSGSTTATGAAQVSAADVVGADAYAEMPALDYVSYWFVEDGETPILKTFATQSALENEAVGKFAAVSASGSETLVNSFEEACDGAYVKLITNAPITLTADTVVDVNNRTVTIDNDGFVLSILDSNSDNYGKAVSKVTVMNEDNLNAVAAKPGAADQYVALKNEDGTYTPHWLYVKLTTASLKANSSSVSIYYKSSIKADSALTDYITAYGIAASLSEIPEDFRNGVAVGYTAQEFEAPEEGDIDFIGVSGTITNVLQKGRQEPDLDTCGTMPIYASAYVTVEIDGETYDVMGVASSSFSLYDLMCKLNNTYTAGSAPENVKALVANWEDPMSGWGLDNLQ